MEPTTTPSGPLSTEPVAVWLAAALAIVNAGLALADVFNWIDTTPEQTTAIGVFVTTVTAIIGALVRGTVYSPSTVADLTAGRNAP